MGAWTPPRARPRVVVTGLGAVTGFGPGAERLFEALVDGERAVARDEALRARGLPSMIARVPGLDVADAERPLAFARIAAAEAVAAAGGVQAGDGLSVCVGTTLGVLAPFLAHVRAGDAASAPAPDREIERSFTGIERSFTWARPAVDLARRYGARAGACTVSVACASGNAALGAALEAIREGRARQVLAGGVDALSDFVLAGFGALKAADESPCRPFDRSRAGLNLGEGAGFLVLEEEGFARGRGARIRAFLDGYGAAADAHHMTGPDPDGGGAARAMRAALADAALAPDEVDYVSAHGTATPFNDRMEARALALALGPRAARVALDSIKGAIGHTLGAAGALEAIVCVRSLESGVVAPTAGFATPDPEIALDVVHGSPRRVILATALSGSSGFGGTNAALVFRRASAAAASSASREPGG